MKSLVVFAVFIISYQACSQIQIYISNTLSDENIECFKIKTLSATYLYDKAGGGFINIIDKQGTDWIQFSSTGKGQYPASAAGKFRGLPNLVHKSADSGAGHPGFEKCITTMVDKNMIRTTSKSGLWQWTWTFENEIAVLNIEKTDPEHAYWFLYEGTPGGKYDPENTYWGTNTIKASYEHGDHYKGSDVSGNWQYAYFGHRLAKRVMFCSMVVADDNPDLYGILGNSEIGMDSSDGMVVFGFGRGKGTKPLMQSNNTFVIGFIEAPENEENHEQILKQIESKTSQSIIK